jgi:hypothetical protein
MTTTRSDSALSLREPTDRQRDEAPNGHVEDETEEKASEEEHILCLHTFANPHGIVFEIGCFGAVEGCGYAGPASDEFSWFKGFSWRVVVCVMCLTHLGWFFESRDGGNFHGLILDRLLFS